MPPRTEHSYDLKLASGRVVTYHGASDEEAAQNYVTLHPTEAVVATRRARRERFGLAIGLRPIVEPGDGKRRGRR